MSSFIYKKCFFYKYFKPKDNWNRYEFAFKKMNFGQWMLELPYFKSDKKTPFIPHNTEIKVILYKNFQKIEIYQF